MNRRVGTDRAAADHRDPGRWNGWRKLRARVGGLSESEEWSALVVLALLAVGLGVWGFHDYERAVGGSTGFWNLLYLALQLFPLQSGAPVAGGLPWQLEVARFLAAFVAALTVVKTLALVLRERLRLARIGRLADHVVVCGLGRKGLLLARSLREQGYRVVAVERDADSEQIESCRATGAEVLIGDARDAGVLRRAGVAGAGHLIAVCGDDGTNADIAVRSRSLLAGREAGALTCTAHVSDPDLCNLLRAQELRDGGDQSLTLEFFNVFEAGARALLNRYPFLPERAAPTFVPHLLVAGLGQFGAEVVVQAARNWSHERGADVRLPVLIVDREGREKTRSLCARYPQLLRLCELDARDIEFESPEFREAAFLGAGERPAVTDAYVCLDDDSRALSAALDLNRALGGEARIVVRTTQEEGLGSLLEGRQGTDPRYQRLHAFPLLDRTCSAELLLGGLYETFARANHEDYVRQQEEQGHTPETSPAMVPWDELDEGLKRSSRAQAHHLGDKLRAIGCDVAPLIDWDAEPFAFTPEQVELLAELEHRRWLDERRAAGWRLGHKTDIEKKTSPWLIPWDELPEDVREQDRRPVRRIPLVLARAGFQVVHLGTPAQRNSSPTEGGRRARAAIGSRP